MITTVSAVVWMMTLMLWKMSNTSGIYYKAKMIRAWYNQLERRYEFYDLAGNVIPLVCKGIVINDNGEDDIAPLATIKVYVDIVNDKPVDASQPVPRNE